MCLCGSQPILMKNLMVMQDYMSEFNWLNYLQYKINLQNTGCVKQANYNIVPTVDLLKCDDN